MFLRFQAIEYDNKFFVNPGTATGAWTGAFNGHVFRFSMLPIPNLFCFRDPIPSFALMDIQGTVVVTYVYQLIEGEVRVEKIEWRKELEPAPVPKNAVPPQAIPSPPRSGSPPSSAGW